MDWRPEGWTNPFECKQRCQMCKEGKDYQNYEAGASAMLEALKEGGVYVTGPEWFYTAACDGIRDRMWDGPGHLIFIPEAQECS